LRECFAANLIEICHKENNTGNWIEILRSDAKHLTNFNSASTKLAKAITGIVNVLVICYLFVHW